MTMQICHITFLLNRDDVTLACYFFFSLSIHELNQVESATILIIYMFFLSFSLFLTEYIFSVLVYFTQISDVLLTCWI